MIFSIRKYKSGIPIMYFIFLQIREPLGDLFILKVIPVSLSK